MAAAMTNRQKIDALACAYFRASEAIEAAASHLDHARHSCDFPEEIRALLYRDAATLTESSFHLNRAGIDLAVNRFEDFRNQRAIYVRDIMAQTSEPKK